MIVHNWYDVVVGGIIGSACALIAFRQTFASVFDFRFNHLLLPRSTSLFHPRPFLPASGSGAGQYYTYQPGQEVTSKELPFTREGGWSYDFATGGGEQNVGAPGDATVLIMNGFTGGTGGYRVGGGGGLGRVEEGQGPGSGLGRHDNGTRFQGP